MISNPPSDNPEPMICIEFTGITHSEPATQRMDQVKITVGLPEEKVTKNNEY